MKTFLAVLFVLLSGAAQADRAPVCTVPDIDFGFSKVFASTAYSFQYDDDTQDLYLVVPSTQYSYYTNVSYTFAHSWTHVTDTPQQFLTQIVALSGAHGILQNEDCNALLTEAGGTLLTF